jgi:hypothetical protein
MFKSISLTNAMFVLVAGMCTLTGYQRAEGHAPFNSALPPVSVTGMTPKEGPIETVVIITGSGFGAAQGASTISFNGVAATPIGWSNTEIKAPVPSGASTGPVRLCVAGECGIVGTFTVTPTIVSVSPLEGPVGAEVTIIGTGFGSNQGTSTVTFNGIIATPASWSRTEITVPVPTGATTGPLIVTVDGWPSNGITFTIIN